MPAAVCLGLHPIVAMGSLSYPPPEVSKFQAVGGLFGEPMEVACCSAIDLEVPAWTEIVIEGEFIAGTREHGACVPGLPVADTVKQVDAAGLVVRTVDRSMLRLAQTPQGARTAWLGDALATMSDASVTDEAAAP